MKIIDENEVIDELELKTSNGSCYAKIDLKKGGSVQHLELQNKIIINNIMTNNYESTFASSILFPFVNRVANGVYDFNNNRYILFTNQVEEKHAIHGLVYDKTFKIEKVLKEHNCSEAWLSYEASGQSQGYPFLYKIILQYILTETSFSLKVHVKNLDTMAIPFSIGWHPYFFSSDLYNSFISMDSNAHFELDARKIPVKLENVNLPEEIQIKNTVFDDCFVLNKNTVAFNTPDYNIDLEISGEKNYVQLFTPIDRKSIAIEPLSSPSNSLNNKIGLTILKPNDVYEKTWNIKIKNTN